MSIAILIVAVLAILFNFFVLYKCAKTWKIFHVILLFFVFAASLTFMAYSALVLKARTSWAKVHRDTSEQMVETEASFAKLRNGWSVDPGADELSEKALTASLERLLMHRRTVWREYRATQANDKSITLTAPEPDPGRATRAMTGNMVVYAFTEIDSGDGYRRPDHYLGEFKTSAASDTGVTLTSMLPTSEISDVQLTQINDSIGNRGVTWTIYEILPPDGHDIFVLGEDEIDEDEDVDQENPSIFGRLMSREEIEAYFPQARMGLAGAEYDQFIDRFVYDGRALHKIKQQNDRFNPPPQAVWVKVRFIKPRVGDNAIAVDAPLTVVGTPAEKKPPYDNRGLAQNADLMQGSKTEFKIGDVAVFNREFADQLINQGDCTKVEDVYVRPLQDFNREFHEAQRRLETLAAEMSVLDRETAQINAIRIQLAGALRIKRIDDESHADYPGTEYAKLMDDKIRFDFERDEIAKYRQFLDLELAAQRSKMSELYRKNRFLAAELAAMQKQLADEINQQTGDNAAAPASDDPLLTPDGQLSAQ